MNTVDLNMLVYIILAVVAILIIALIVKKAVKVLVFLVVLFLMFFAYNVIIKGASPVEEAKGYVSDIKYGKNIAQYSNKIKISVDNIEKVGLTKEHDASSLEILIAESSNLSKLYDEVKVLEHREKFDSFHNKYCSYVKNIVDGTSIITKLGSISNEKNYKMVEEAIKKLKLNLEELPSIKEISKLKE